MTKNNSNISVSNSFNNYKNQNQIANRQIIGLKQVSEVAAFCFYVEVKPFEKKI